MTTTTASILVGGLLIASSAHAQDWTERQKEDGVTVWTADYAGSKYKQFKGQTVVAAPLDDVLAVVLDVEQYEAWFPNTPDARLLDHTGDVITYYVVTDLPWPVTSRDAVYRYRVTRSDDAATLDVSVDASAFPEQDGMVRVQASSGKWTFTPTDAGTQVTWQLHFEPNGSLPAWLANSAVVDTPASMLKALRERVAAVR